MSYIPAVTGDLQAPIHLLKNWSATALNASDASQKSSTKRLLRIGLKSALIKLSTSNVERTQLLGPNPIHREVGKC